MRIVIENDTCYVYSDDGGRLYSWYVGSIPAPAREHVVRAMYRMVELGQADKAREIRAALGSAPQKHNGE